MRFSVAGTLSLVLHSLTKLYLNHRDTQYMIDFISKDSEKVRGTNISYFLWNPSVKSIIKTSGKVL